MPSPALARKRPYSAKKRRAQLLEKRAIKRGDISPPQPVKADKHKVWSGHAAPSDSQAREAARRLQSAFVKLDKRFLQDSMEMAAVLHLERPVPDEVAILRAEPLVEAQLTGKLTCPVRPEWRYDMSKQQLEENEEVVFQKWLDQADDIVHEWCNPFEVHPSDDETRSPAMPRAPTVFERNLEVWRQLWRVSEISQIILVLLDSRCPLLHFPPSLVAYLSASQEANRTRTILVLTKVDIIGPTRADEWTRSLQAKYPGMPVVRVEAYAEADQTTGQGKGKTHAHQPHIPLQFKESLVQALRDMHAELLEPPQRPEGSIFLQRRSVVRKSVSWDAVLHAQGEQVRTVVGGASASSPHGAEGTESEPEYLTVGLIGQPNVGKSSLLNALFGINKVQASHTPGKTKHFQTLFWTPEVRLVDCPGLVMPNLVAMEMQVLGGMLPISRVSAIPSCIHHAARLLPLAHILDLAHPSLNEPQAEDKRTWRGGATRAREAKVLEWTAIDVLLAYANKKAWVVARSGRPDVMRAGNAILRLLAEGKISWAFWPEDTPRDVRDAHSKAGHGIWIPNGNDAAALLRCGDMDDQAGESELEEESSEGPEEDDDGVELGSDDEDADEEEEEEDEEVDVAKN